MRYDPALVSVDVRGIWVLLLWALLLAPRMAAATVMDSLGLVTPLLATCQGQIRTIQLGGEPGTSLILIGSGLLNGDTRLIASEGSIGIYLIVQDRSGEWSLAQQVEVRGSEYSSAVVDVDGDGLQDLLVTSVDGPDRHLYALRQRTGEARLAPPAGIEISSLRSVDWMGRFDRQGRLLVLGHRPGEHRLRALIIEWTLPDGLRILNEHVSDLVPGGYLDVHGCLPQEDRGVIFGVERDGESVTSVGMFLREDGWGKRVLMPLPFWYRENFALVHQEDGDHAYYWGMEIPWIRCESDTLYELVPTLPGDSVTVRSLPIEGLPNHWCGHMGTQSQVVQLADSPILAKGGQFAYGPEGVILEFGPDGRPRVQNRWIDPPSLVATTIPMGALIRGNDGTLAILWNLDGGWVLLPPCAGVGPPATVSATLDQALALADLDGNGRKDVLAYKPLAGGSAPLVLLRGIAEHPWFQPPVIIEAPYRMIRAYPGDFDGDGTTEILGSYEDFESGQTWLELLDWNGGALRREPPSAVQWIVDADACVGDFSGRGRAEVFCPNLNGGTFFSWTADRQPTPAVQASTPIVGVVWFDGDFDGDGKDDLLVQQGSYLCLWSLDSITGTVRLEGMERASQTLMGGAPVNFDADRAMELFWSDYHTVNLWSWDGLTSSAHKSAFSSVMVECQPWGQSVDLEADGTPELVLESYSGSSLNLIHDLEGTASERVWVLADDVAGVRRPRRPGAWWTDVDGDGDPDLVVMRTDGIRVGLNTAIRDQDGHPASLQTRLLSANPGPGPISTAVRMAHAGTLEIKLFNVRGRSVWESQMSIGITDWVQLQVGPAQGKRRLPSGVYFLRLRSAEAQAIQRIVLLR